jgi:hypothetical protein
VGPGAKKAVEGADLNHMVLFYAVASVAFQTTLAPDVSRSTIANGPVSGKLGGQPFSPTRVELQPLGLSTVTTEGKVQDKTRQYTLKFRTGDDFFADAEVAVWIAFDDGTPIAPRTWHWKPTAFGTDAHRAQSYSANKPGGSVGRGLTMIAASLKTGTFMEGYSAHLQFVRIEKGVLVGRIALVLPDKHKSYLNGSFRAKIMPQLR